VSKSNPGLYIKRNLLLSSLLDRAFIQQLKSPHFFTSQFNSITLHLFLHSFILKSNGNSTNHLMVPPCLWLSIFSGTDFIFVFLYRFHFRVLLNDSHYFFLIVLVIVVEIFRRDWSSGWFHTTASKCNVEFTHKEQVKTQDFYVKTQFGKNHGEG